VPFKLPFPVKVRFSNPLDFGQRKTDLRKTYANKI